MPEFQKRKANIAQRDKAEPNRTYTDPQTGIENDVNNEE